MVLELILTFFLVTAVFATAVDPGGAFKAIAGLAIGLTITIDVFTGGPITGAAMNPARAFGPELRLRPLVERVDLLRRSGARRTGGGTRLRVPVPQAEAAASGACVLDQPALRGPARQLVPVRELQLAQHRRDVRLDRPGRVGVTGDLLVPVATGDELQHFTLPRRQLVELGSGAGRSPRTLDRKRRPRREDRVTVGDPAPLRSRSGPEILWVT